MISQSLLKCPVDEVIHFGVLCFLIEQLTLDGSVLVGQTLDLFVLKKCRLTV